MTGTGAQTSPLVPTDWSEFIEAVGTEGAYVSCPADTTWNISHIAPGGIKTVVLKCTEIRGNGLKIYGIYAKDTAVFYCDSGTAIYDLHILNVYLSAVSESCSFVYSYRNAYYPTFEGCRISAACTGSASAQATFCGTNHQAGKMFNHCAVSVIGYNNFLFAAGAYGDYPIFENCGIELETNTAETICIGLQESEFIVYADADIEIDDRSANSVIYPEKSRGTITSSDSVTTVLASSEGLSESVKVSGGIKICTPDQIRDPDYLGSIAFLSGGA